MHKHVPSRPVEAYWISSSKVKVTWISGVFWCAWYCGCPRGVLSLEHGLTVVVATCRRISTVNQWLERSGYDVTRLWKEIDDVVIKTLISAHTSLRHNYRSCFPSHIRGSACFEVLGFDIVMDSKLRPLVLEVRLGRWRGWVRSTQPPSLSWTGNE